MPSIAQNNAVSLIISMSRYRGILYLHNIHYYIVQPQIIWLIAEMFIVGSISLCLVSLTIEYMIIAVLFYTDTLHIFDKK